MKEDADEAFAEWAKCEATCAECHDQGEKSGGKLRAGGKMKRSGAERVEHGGEKNKKQKQD